VSRHSTQKQLIAEDDRATYGLAKEGLADAHWKHPKEMSYSAVRIFFCKDFSAYLEFINPGNSHIVGSNEILCGSKRVHIQGRRRES
jgi:hypothetical protein